MKKGSKEFTIRRYDAQIAHNVKKARLRAEAKQRDLAALFGVSVQQIQKYETGVTRISSGKLFALAKFLGISVNSLYEGLDKKTHRTSSEAQISTRHVSEIETLYFNIKNKKVRKHFKDMMKLFAEQEQLAQNNEKQYIEEQGPQLVEIIE